MRKGRVLNRGWRVFGVVVALVVLPSLAPDLFGLSCPHHPAAHANPGEATHGSDSQGDHGHGAAEADGPETPAPDHEAPCTCAGSCPVSGSVSAPATYLHPIHDTARRIARPATPAVPAPRGPVPYLLPFANAPPLA